MNLNAGGILVCASAALLAAAPTEALAKDPELPSAWRTADVLIDGASDDWAGKLVPLGGLPVVVGAQNDATFLYVCLKTSDEAAKKQILAVGLTVYLDASAKESHGFGVRFPVGRLGRENPDLPETDDPAIARSLDLSAAGAHLEVLGGDKEADRGVMTVSEARPIEAALGEQDGSLVVELKVPLAFSVETPLAIDTRPGKVIALGIDTSPPKLKRSRGEGSGGPGGGFGGGGRMGRMGGGRGGRMSRGERDVTKSYGKPLKAWLTVPLAAAK